MQLPPSDHVVWSLVRMALRAVIVASCLALFYNKVDKRDLLTLIAFLVGDGVITTLSRIGQSENRKTPKDDE